MNHRPTALGKLPPIPGYVTVDDHEASLAHAQRQKLIWAGGAAVAGVALGALMATAVATAFGRT